MDKDKFKGIQKYNGYDGKKTAELINNSEDVIRLLRNIPITEEEREKKLDICEKIANFEQEYINIFGCK